MALIKEAYTPNGINRIYQLLKNEAEKGKAKEFDIKVDNLKVVSRTDDPERFFEHEEFLVTNSRHITVNIYDGSSTRCNRYMLLLAEEEPAKEELSGIDKTISLRVQQERKGWEYERQKKEMEQLTEELAENGKYITKLEEEIKRMRAEKQKMPGKLTETLIALAGVYIARNPNALNGIPILGHLLSGDAANKQTSEQVISHAEEPADKDEEIQSSFKRVKTPVYTGEVTDEDFEMLEEALTPVFPPEHKGNVITILKLMYFNNHIIPEIVSLLTDAQQEQRQAA